MAVVEREVMGCDRVVSVYVCGISGGVLVGGRRRRVAVVRVARQAVVSEKSLDPSAPRATGSLLSSARRRAGMSGQYGQRSAPGGRRVPKRDERRVVGDDRVAFDDR
jgi:hypothetical protein